METIALVSLFVFHILTIFLAVLFVISKGATTRNNKSLNPSPIGIALAALVCSDILAFFTAWIFSSKPVREISVQDILVPMPGILSLVMCIAVRQGYAAGQRDGLSIKGEQEVHARPSE